MGKVRFYRSDEEWLALAERLKHTACPHCKVDEFGYDRIERSETPQAADLMYKIIDARNQKRSTALVTNIDFKNWPTYLGDENLASASLDRIVDGAIILRINGKSYRAHRAKQLQNPSEK